MYDVVIIGAGIIGTAVARELSRYQLDVMVLERQSDLAEGTTKANSGIIHAGFDCEPGTDKARLNVRGNQLYEQLSKELDFPFLRNGSMVLAFSEAEAIQLNQLKEKGELNGVKGLIILNKQQVVALEPNVNPQVVSALYAPSGGIISPYKACIAFAENSAANGVCYQFNTEVTGISRILDGQAAGYQIYTNRGNFDTKVIINAAGLCSDKINNFLSEIKYQLTPRKGEYLLFDKALKGYVNSTLFQLPNQYGKGVLVTPTADGNLMIGPSAEDLEDKQDTSTHTEILKKVSAKAAHSVPILPMNQIITSFAGLRAHNQDCHDFIVAAAPDAAGLINAIGIESPGLSAAPAIAEEIARLVGINLELIAKENFVKERSAIQSFCKQSVAAQNRLIANDCSYGKIVCRCESITEGEIVEAIRRPLGATTVDGVKRRVRAGFGRCQGGFCTAKIIEILARETKREVSSITKCGGNSNIIYHPENSSGQKLDGEQK